MKMYRFLLFIILAGLVWRCAPKLASSSTADYDEDVSSFRPAIEQGEAEKQDAVVDTKEEKGPYVAPTHDINGEMASLMDSIITHNREKTYRTYTIQVYIGRSREEANKIREKIYRVLPDERPQLTYRQPSYKVTVGKYFDRVDAYKTLNMLKETFPGALLVPERHSLE